MDKATAIAAYDFATAERMVMAKAVDFIEEKAGGPRKSVVMFVRMYGFERRGYNVEAPNGVRR